MIMKGKAVILLLNFKVLSNFLLDTKDGLGHRKRVVGWEMKPEQ